MDWRVLEAAVDRTTAGAFGETVRISFLHGGAVDPARAAVVTRAVLHVIGGDPVRTGPGDTFRSHVATHTAELLLDRSSYTGPIPVRGDKVRAVDRAGQPWFEVASVSDRFTNLIAVSLG
ncbi:MAG: hypothetical protein B7Z15_12175 [Rhizobiales bacterium 32-66-8]|nr:MAG: hypothetical protein B7Z15_12175 [Rhizobiales bacterium 32-66-8]